MTSRGLAAQALNLHQEGLAFYGNFDRGLGQFTNLNVVPVIPNFDPKCGYRQLRFPIDRERS